MKLNKNQIEFVNNTIKINEILFNLSDKEIKKLFALHKEQRDKLLQNIASIILEYKVTNEFMDLSNEEKKILNERLGNEVNETFKEQNKIEKQGMDNLLKKIAEDKFYMNLQEYGNTSAASIPLALGEMNEKGMLRPGDKIICVGFGGGLTWGATLMEWS